MRQDVSTFTLTYFNVKVNMSHPMCDEVLLIERVLEEARNLFQLSGFVEDDKYLTRD